MSISKDQYRNTNKLKIIFNNIISKPLWWTNDVTKLYLGTYSRKKYEEFVKCTNISDFGKLSTAEKRQYALTFKYYIAVNNVMDKMIQLVRSFRWLYLLTN